MKNCLCLKCKKKSVLHPDSIKFRAENRRTKLIELIGENPGISFRDLMRLGNLKNGVLSHHLRKLEKKGVIKTERLSRQTRFYPLDFSDEKSRIAKALRRKTPRDIIHTLMISEEYGKESLNFTEISSNIPKSPSTVSLYLSQLIRDSIVKVTLGVSRRKQFHLCNRPLIENLIEDHKPGIFEKSASGFEDMINSL